MSSFCNMCLEIILLKVLPFLTRLVVNIAVNKINIQRVRYHYSDDRVTIVRSLWCHQQLIMMSSTKWHLTRLVVNIAVYKIDIQRVRYHYSHDGVTIVRSLWCHQQLIMMSSTEWRLSKWFVKIIFLSSFMDSLCRVRNKIIYVLSWRTVPALTGVLFWCLFDKHHNNTVMSTETVRHLSTYIIPYISKTNELNWPCGKLITANFNILHCLIDIADRAIKF